MRFCNGTMEKHDIHKTNLQTAGIGGKTLPKPLLVATSTPSVHRHHLLQEHTWWRGSSSPPGLWDCGSNLYQTPSRASLARVTWATYHDCDHICITRMVDLMFVRWFMKCKDVYVLDIWVYVFVNPFLCACSDQTGMLGRVWGMCALVGAIL
jgi:hypothetical protein